MTAPPAVTPAPPPVKMPDKTPPPPKTTQIEVPAPAAPIAGTVYYYSNGAYYSTNGYSYVTTTQPVYYTTSYRR
jgi:hypothetical protein